MKDATPYNILFRGPNGMFIDILSVEKRTPTDPTWLPYAQCVRSFLLPLLVDKYFGVSPDQSLVRRRDGLEPEEVYRMCGVFRKWLYPFIILVSIPKWLGSKDKLADGSIYRKRRLRNSKKAKFIFESQIRWLRRLLTNLEPKPGKSRRWSNYIAADNNYSEAQFASKEDFVQGVMDEFRPDGVLEIGCNNGHFSAIAARNGARVVAIDTDPVLVGDVWRWARSEGLDILPLVIDITRPSPAIGWRDQECPLFLDRARGAFDAVLMLAVIHHLLVTERIPLPEIIDLAAELTRDILIIEFIDPADSMFRRMVRGRGALFTGMTREFFETICRRHFEIVRSRHIDESRRYLYLLRKK